MNIRSIDNYSNENVASVLSNALQGSGLSINPSGNSGNSVSSVSGGADSSQLSPFAQLLSTLQQLQQSNPTQYAQVMQKIATNLQTAAQTATSNGNTSEASHLTQLAKDFTTASTSGQLQNIQDLAKALGGGGHHHHMHPSSGGVDSDGDSDGSGGSSSSSSSSGSATGSSSATSQALQELLAALQSTSTQSSSSLNPMSIIMNTLSNSGITPTNG